MSITASPRAHSPRRPARQDGRSGRDAPPSGLEVADGAAVPSQAARTFARATLQALVAADTLDTLAARIEALLSHDRRLVAVRRTLNNDQLRICPGLRLDPSAPTPIRVGAPNEGNGTRTLHVDLSPGIDGFSLTAHAGTTEQALAPAWENRRRGGADVCQVRLHGLGDIARRDDRIEVERWNASGVGQLLVLAFQCDHDY